MSVKCWINKHNLCIGHMYLMCYRCKYHHTIIPTHLSFRSSIKFSFILLFFNRPPRQANLVINYYILNHNVIWLQEIEKSNTYNQGIYQATWFIIIIYSYKVLKVISSLLLQQIWLHQSNHNQYLYSSMV